MCSMVVSPPGNFSVFGGGGVLYDGGVSAAKFLLLRSNSGEVLLIAWAVRSVVSLRFAFGWDFLCRAFFLREEACGFGLLFACTELGDGGSGGSLPLSTPGRQCRWAFIVLNSPSRWFGGGGSCGFFQCLELRCGAGLWILLLWFAIRFFCFLPGLPLRDSRRGAAAPELKKNGMKSGLMYACVVFFFLICRGSLVKWVCIVLFRAI